MKKKILLLISMFIFITNAKALTFNVNLTDIEDKGSNSLGIIENISIPNKELDVLFQDVGDEVNFELTMTNSGDRAGTLRSITVTSTSNYIDYRTNLPDGGLSINGNDNNKVIVTAKLKEGAVNGTSTSEIKIKYNYDEGSCPDGEILSEDESECLCPEGLIRNEDGVCIKPDKSTIECKDDEIYNKTKKICEKKEVPIPIETPNPKTRDNIILVSLLFILSGLGIYASIFKKLKTDKKRISVGVLTAVITLVTSFSVLAGVFGLDNLLSAIVNPITRTKEIIVKVNERIDMIETWDGTCSLETNELTPDKIFEGGSGTQDDPYQIKTANQLACFAASVNNGTTYEGQYVTQIRNIKLNDDLASKATANNLDDANVWTPAGYVDRGSVVTSFNGTYDGDNYKIDGLYINSNSAGQYKGLFGCATNAVFKNMILSDVYMNASGNDGALLGYGYKNLTLNNIKTYGSSNAGWDSAGIVSNYDGNNEGILDIENTENNINLTTIGSCGGVIHRLQSANRSIETNIIFRNVTNKGSITYVGEGFNISGTGGIAGYINTGRNIIFDNCSNTGDFYNLKGSQVGGLAGYSGGAITATNSYNTGNWHDLNVTQSGGLFGTTGNIIADNLYNSGNLQLVETHTNSLNYVGGLFGHPGKVTITNSYNTGDIEGYIAYAAGLVSYGNSGSTMENCYNIGNIKGYGYVGGLIGDFNGGSISKSYNTGTIEAYAGSRAGGLVGWGRANIYNSYNTGNLNITSPQSNQIGGLCSADCGEIKNSYNRGNITSKYGGQLAGIASNTRYIENCYNSGKITFEGLPVNGVNDQPVLTGGISYNGPSNIAKNVYNLGDIDITLEGSKTGYVGIGGIASYSSGHVDKGVNTGNISVNVKQLGENVVFYLNGIVKAGGTTSNSFNAGTITVTDSTTSDQTYSILATMIGEITDKYDAASTNNKFKNQNGHALGCIGVPNMNTCTEENSLLVGTYTTEDAPDILSIINGDDAFEIKQGETLPTLKVFNN